MDELKYYSRNFSVAIIPFKINDISKATSPVKLFEYMAQGLPIVTTALPECKLYKSCNIAETKEEFSKLLNSAVQLKEDKNYQTILIQEAKANTWNKIYNIIKNSIENI